MIEQQAVQAPALREQYDKSEIQNSLYNQPFWSSILPVGVITLAADQFHPVHRQRDGPPILIDFARKQKRPVVIEHMAEAELGFGEKSVLADAGLVLEG